MNGSEATYALAILNFVVCTGIGFAAVCRLTAMSSRTSLRYRLAYSLQLVAATSSGWAPVLWHEWPGVSQVGLSLAMLAVLSAGARRWRCGAPDDTCRRSA